MTVGCSHFWDESWGDRWWSVARSEMSPHHWLVRHSGCGWKHVVIVHLNRHDWHRWDTSSGSVIQQSNPPCEWSTKRDPSALKSLCHWQPVLRAVRREKTEFINTHILRIGNAGEMTAPPTTTGALIDRLQLKLILHSNWQPKHTIQCYWHSKMRGLSVCLHVQVKRMIRISLIMTPGVTTPPPCT